LIAGTIAELGQAITGIAVPTGEALPVIYDRNPFRNLSASTSPGCLEAALLGDIEAKFRPFPPVASRC